MIVNKLKAWGLFYILEKDDSLIEIKYVYLWVNSWKESWTLLVVS